MPTVNGCTYFTSTQDTVTASDIHGDVHTWAVTVPHDCILTLGHDKVHECRCGGAFSDMFTGQREDTE